jgi:anti-sigma-K factor RskA
MRYDRPELGERLAADYVLGMMPRRARYRFDRLIASNATLAALVAGWAERLKPLETTSDDVAPPARVWRAIERRIGISGPAPAPPRPRIAIFTFWRGIAAIAVTACAVLAIYVAVSPATLPSVVAELADKTGLAGWIAAAPPRAGAIGVSLMSPGVSERERPRWLRAALLLSADGRLTITVEPPPAQH